LAFLVAAFGAADASGRGSLFSAAWAVWLGEVSYAFYLVHQLVVRLFAKATGVGHAALPGIGLALAALIVAVAGSVVLYRWVELRGVRWLAGRRSYVAQHRH
jgi:peptidoglycan/LPS O-acetylase OafA/YrhL